jgi:hypothetical protein
MISRKGQGIVFEQSWVDRMLSWVKAWADAAANVHDLGVPFDEGTYREYLRWFHRATCVRCSPMPIEVAPHEAEITDTFVMEPPAAFHALVSKFVNFFILSLLCQSVTTIHATIHVCLADRYL